MLEEHVQDQAPDEQFIDDNTIQDTTNDFFNFRNILITAFLLGLSIVIISLVT